MNPAPQALTRRSHAHLDLAHRRRKADKIASLLALHRPLSGLSILEVGAGSGAISALFAERVGERGEVTAVDLVDERVIEDGYRFVPVDGVELPFDDDRFDMVISNHVIEHVGDRRQQLEHLRQIARVMRPDGIAYLAVPNRWALIEPHFKLPLLSWLPRGLRDGYVRLAGKGSHYDCDPPGPIEVRRLFKGAGLAYAVESGAAIRLMAEQSGAGLPIKAVAGAPLGLLTGLNPLYSSMLFTLRARPGAAG